MTIIKTVTLAEIRDLKWAREKAAEWKGNTDPESFDEFDEWIADIDKAIKSVERDRKILRSMLKELNETEGNDDG